MKYLLIIFSLLLFTGCRGVLPAKHDGAEQVNINGIVYASYIIGSVEHLEFIEESEVLLNTRITARPSIVSTCYDYIGTGTHRFQKLHVYTEQHILKLAVPFSEDCDISKFETMKYAEQLNSQRIMRKKQHEEERAVAAEEKKRYLQSEKYAEKSMEQVAIKLIHAENCLTNRMLTMNEYSKEVERLKSFAKKEGNRYYSESVLKEYKVLVRRYFDPSWTSKYISTSYEYCRATKHR